MIPWPGVAVEVSCAPLAPPALGTSETAVTSEQPNALADCLGKRAQNPNRKLPIHWPRKIILHSTGSHPALEFGTVIGRQIRNQRPRRPPSRLVKQPSAAGLFDRAIVNDHDLYPGLSEIKSRVARLYALHRAPCIAQSVDNQRKNRLVPRENYRRSSGFLSRRDTGCWSFMRSFHPIPLPVPFRPAF